MNKVEIVNLALTHIDAHNIQDIDEDTKEARVAKVLFAPCVNFCLRNYAYSFATRVKELGQAATENIIGWRYGFVLPTDLIVVQEVYDHRSKKEVLPPIRYEIIHGDTHDRVLCCDNPRVIIRYTSNNVREMDFDAAFCNALSYYLAAEMATSLKAIAALSKQMLQMYEMQLTQSVAIDGNERGEHKRRIPDYVRARSDYQ